MRDFIYSFGGCVMDGAEYLNNIEPGHRHTTMGMSTIGVISLLAGKNIELDAKQLSDIKANTKYNENNTNYDSLNIDLIKGFIWTAITDILFIIPNMKCADSSIYPINNGEFNSVIPSTQASFPDHIIKGFWSMLEVATRQIPYKVILKYPTDHLKSKSWKLRIDVLQNFALDFFSYNGWHVEAFEPELDESNFWSHYSSKSKHKVWDNIKKYLNGVNLCS